MVGTAVCLAAAIVSAGCSTSTNSSEESTRPYYTAQYDDIIYYWIDCIAQTDDRVTSDNVKITMVEAKYFAVTEKYGCKLIKVNGTQFRFIMKLPHGRIQQIFIDGAHMAEGFKIVANDFDKQEYIKQWENASQDYSDVPDKAGLEEDAEYYQETLRKIANELEETEKQPDIGLITLHFIGRGNVDSRSLSYDVEEMVGKSNLAE